MPTESFIDQTTVSGKGTVLCLHTLSPLFLKTTPEVDAILILADEDTGAPRGSVNMKSRKDLGPGALLEHEPLSYSFPLCGFRPELNKKCRERRFQRNSSHKAGTSSHRLCLPWFSYLLIMSEK